MNQYQFMVRVVKECDKRSFMTRRFSKRQFKKFRRWFFMVGKRNFSWRKERCQTEWDTFVSSFKIEVNDDS